jgi:hypothetical protein
MGLDTENRSPICEFIWQVHCARLAVVRYGAVFMSFAWGREYRAALSPPPSPAVSCSRGATCWPWWRGPWIAHRQRH